MRGVNPFTVRGPTLLPRWPQQRGGAGPGQMQSYRCLLIPGDLPGVSRQVCQIERRGPWQKRSAFWTGARKPGFSAAVVLPVRGLILTVVWEAETTRAHLAADGPGTAGRLRFLAR